jgi:hypothetical protein
MQYFHTKQDIKIKQHGTLNCTHQQEAVISDTMTKMTLYCGTDLKSFLYCILPAP